MGVLWISSAALLLMQQAVTEPVARADYLKVMDGEFKQLDGDGDGRVTAQEAAAKLARDQRNQALAANRQIFAQLDKDKNGALSPEEFAGLIATPAVDPSALMQRLDLNKDGIVNLIEHRTVMLATFDAIDSDKDGVVTPAEMQVSQQRPPQSPPSAAKR
jgi:Ca2+-binding EF-hand superfamily protein